MTKKHYEAICEIIKSTREQCNHHLHSDRIARNLADYFATDNPKFDRTRFLQSCGINN